MSLQPHKQMPPLGQVAAFAEKVWFSLLFRQKTGRKKGDIKNYLYLYDKRKSSACTTFIPSCVCVKSQSNAMTSFS